MQWIDQNLPNIKGSRIQKGIQLTSNYCVDFSILDHCGSQAYTCGNIDLSQQCWRRTFQKWKDQENKKESKFLTSNYWVDFSILDHCGSQAYTCGNIDLSQSSAITVKRCWHIHHPLSKRLIQSPERLGIGWSDVISPLLYAAMVTLLAKPGGHS